MIGARREARGSAALGWTWVGNWAKDKDSGCAGPELSEDNLGAQPVVPGHAVLCPAALRHASPFMPPSSPSDSPLPLCL